MHTQPKRQKYGTNLIENSPPVKKIAFKENFRIFGDKRLNVVAMQVTRVFHVSYTFYAQRYPQVVRCQAPQNALSCVQAQKKPYM